MDQRTIGSCSVISTNGPLTDLGSIDWREGVHPSKVSTKINRAKTERQFCPELEVKAKTLQWALNRIASWGLPGTEYVEDYCRHMYRRNFRPKTYFSSLTALHVFLTVVRDSGKTRLEEITKNDLEAFIEHEQDRGLMLSTVRTRLHCVNAFLGYVIEAGIVSGAVLARRIRLKKPETCLLYTSDAADE